MRSHLPIALALVAGCVPSNAERRDTLRTRAAFDLRCSANALTITDLGLDNDRVAPRVNVAGVDGCGKRLTYLYDAQRGVWVLNAVDGQQLTGTNNAALHDPAQKEAN